MWSGEVFAPIDSMRRAADCHVQALAMRRHARRGPARRSRESGKSTPSRIHDVQMKMARARCRAINELFARVPSLRCDASELPR